MDTPNEIIADGIWSITELEEAARDMVDVGIWETAEEEERACIESTRTDSVLSVGAVDSGAENDRQQL